MVVTPESFSLHLDLIKNYMEFVSLAEWLARKNNNQALPKMACAITFDDGWADNYEYAFPLLQKKSVPATIYLVSDMTGTDKLFWPERLAHTLSWLASCDKKIYSHPVLDWLNSIHPINQFNQQQPTSEQISQIINNVKTLGDDEIQARIDTIESEFDFNTIYKTPSLLNWEQLREMTNTNIIEVGSHTRHHIRLNSTVSDDILADEITGSKKIIEEHTDKPVKTFCFPNGDYCDRSLAMVKQNYSGAVSTRAGWNNSASDGFLLHRIGIHEDIAYDKTAFLARASGWV